MKRRLPGCWYRFHPSSVVTKVALKSSTNWCLDVFAINPTVAYTAYDLPGPKCAIACNCNEVIWSPNRLQTSIFRLISDSRTIPSKPTKSASNSKSSPVPRRPMARSKPERTTNNWRLWRWARSPKLGVTGLISTFPCPKRAAPKPARFSFSTMKSGVLQLGQWTAMQIFWKVLIDTLSTPGSGATIRSIKRTSESQQMLRMLNLVFTDKCSWHSPIVVGLTSICSVWVQQAQESSKLN